jgi:hypothetical protein
LALTAKQEAFAQAVGIRNLSHLAAYSEVYDISRCTPESVSSLSSRLAADDSVRSRIEVLKARVLAKTVEKAALSLADCIAEADIWVQDAQALGNTSAGVAATKLRAQLSGHLAEKTAEKKGALEDSDVASLLAMRDAINAQLQRAKDALDMVGDLDGVRSSAPVPMRRVIG